MKDLGVLDLLSLAGFKADPTDRIVRHQSDRYPVSELLNDNLLEVYQAYQRIPVFHEAKHVLSFYGLEGTRARFFGVFKRQGWRSAKAQALVTGAQWEIEW